MILPGQVTPPTLLNGGQPRRQAFYRRHRSGEVCPAFPGNDVVGHSHIDGSQPEPGNLFEALTEKFRSVAQLLVDLNAGVTPSQPLQRQAPAGVRRRQRRKIASEFPASTAGAAALARADAIGAAMRTATR